MTKRNGIAPKVAKSEIVINLNGIKGKDKKFFTAAVQKAADEQDDEPLYEWLARVVIAWPYDFDPKAPASYGELGLLELREVASCFWETFRGLLPANVKVDGGGETGTEGSSGGSLASANGG